MSRTVANLALLLAAAIWGGAFVVQKVVLDSLGPITFTGIRFLIGAVVVLPLALRALKNARVSPAEWIGMVATGGALFAGAILQQIGIGTTTAANAGFLTTLYVPLVPLIEMAVLRRPPHPVVWPAALGCMAGSWLLSGGFNPTPGDVWVMVSAVFWAAQVFLVGALSARTGVPTVVALVEFVVCGALSTIWGLASEPVSMAGLIDAGAELAYTGVLSVGGAFTIQAIGQRYTTGADAAVIISAEAPFAALFGALTLGEWMNGTQLAGCVLILACILLVQLVPAWQDFRAA